jgi:hypothetical protein
LNRVLLVKIERQPNGSKSETLFQRNIKCNENLQAEKRSACFHTKDPSILNASSFSC